MAPLSLRNQLCAGDDVTWPVLANEEPFRSVESIVQIEGRWMVPLDDVDTTTARIKALFSHSGSLTAAPEEDACMNLMCGAKHASHE